MNAQRKIIESTKIAEALLHPLKSLGNSPNVKGWRSESQYVLHVANKLWMFECISGMASAGSRGECLVKLLCERSLIYKDTGASPMFNPCTEEG